MIFAPYPYSVPTRRDRARLARVVYIVVSFIFLQAPLMRLGAEQLPDSTKVAIKASSGKPDSASGKLLPELSKSIVDEALSKTPSKPLTGAPGVLADVVTRVVSSNRPTVAADGTVASQPRPTLRPETFLPTLPSLPLRFADGAVTGTLSPSSTTLQYKSNKSMANAVVNQGYYKPLALANLGLTRMQPNVGDQMTGLHFDVANMFFDYFAGGLALTSYTHRQDYVLNTVLQIPGSGFRLKGSAGYMTGRQSFAFPSGQQDIDLTQTSWLFSTQYIIPGKEKSLNTIHSFGASVWAAQAHQMTGTDITHTAVIPPDPAAGPYGYWEIVTDWMKLSEGRLLGASVDTQAALRCDLVAKGALGYEQLTFPFSDGTVERNRSLYYNLDLFYEFDKSITFVAGYKSGVGENRMSLAAKLSQLNFNINLFKDIGKNGVGSNYGASAFWSINIPPHSDQKSRKPVDSPDDNLAKRMRPHMIDIEIDSYNLLDDAITRPSQIPSTFLAKVDPTASLRTRISQSVGDVSDGDIYVSVGDEFGKSGGTMMTIESVVRNGVSYANADTKSSFSTTSIAGVGKLVIRINQLPTPTPLPGSDSDIYLVNIIDALDTNWQVIVHTFRKK